MAEALIEELHRSLRLRLRPEDVAEMILRGAGDALDEGERALLDQAARHSLSRLGWDYSSMAAQFFEAVAPTRQVAKARELFASAPVLTAEDCAEPARLRAFAQTISAEISKAVGASSFKHDRLNRAARAAQGVELSRRRYNKLFRFLRRFEAKLDAYERQLKAAEDQQMAKTGVAGRIPFAWFEASPEAALFVAYYAARRNRRSVFTSTGQDPAYDEIARMLLGRLRRRPTREGWRAAAYVMPDAEVIGQLDDAAKMEVFAVWLESLADLAGRMEQAWRAAAFDRATMIVRRGDDSSTWNALAGAWNASRAGWIAAVFALGMEEALEEVCLGKAMRLMAADVARWHGELHPDTAVWAALPAPWEVFSGQAVCTRAQVEIACAEHKVDPIGGGWIAPRSGRRAAPFRPTPELVHGVAVDHPALAQVLRHAGWFSGRPSRPLPDGVAALVERDERGFALGVKSVSPLPSLLKRWFGGQ